MTRTRTSLSLGGLTRKYVYWSGNPIWVDERGREHDVHPSGCRRDFIIVARARRDGIQEAQGFWAWIWEGRPVEDTLNAFMSRY